MYMGSQDKETKERVYCVVMADEDTTKRVLGRPSSGVSGAEIRCKNARLGSAP